MGNPVHIIHLEDNEYDAELVHATLEREGIHCEVTRARSRQQFETELNRADVDLIISDYSLPGFDGVSALRLTRQRHAEVPFILLSGTIGEQAAIETLTNGATDYVLKHQLDRLVPAVQRALREAEERRARRAAEDAVREREERFRAFMDHTLTEAFIKDAEGRYVYVNHAMESLVGMPASEIIGKTDFDLWPADFARQFRQHDVEVLGTGHPINIVESATVNDRRVRHWLVSKFPLHDAAGRSYLGGIAVEITDRLRAEQTLTRERQLMKAVLDNAQAAILACDSRGALTLSNKTAQQWLGEAVAPMSLEQLARVCVQAGVPEDASLFRALQEQAVRDVEVQLRPAQGPARTCLVSGQAIADEAGRKLGAVVVMHDISERKRAEAVREQFVNLGRGLSLAATPRDAAHIILEAADKLLGWDACSLNLHFEGTATVAPILGFDLILGERREISTNPPGSELTPLMRKVLESGPQLILRQPGTDPAPDLVPFGDEARRSASILAVPVRHGLKIVGFLSIHSYKPNAYSQKDLETLQALAEHCGGVLERIWSTEQIQQQAALLDESTDAIFVRDLDQRITYWNRGAQRLYGWKAGEVLGKRASEILYKDKSEQAERARAAVMEKGEWIGELNQVTREGKEIVVLSRRSLMRDAEGKPRSVLQINSDITEKKQLETQFLRTQRLESIGTLAGGIAHDLNNVLAPMIMAVQLLRMNQNDDSTTKLLDTLESSAQRGAGMVRQILSFARGLEGERAELQLKHLIADQIKISKDTFPRSIKVVSRTAKDLWTVIGDSTQLYQVLMNLCVNARDAMPQGGTLTVEAENIVLDEHYARLHVEAKPGPYVVLTVKDSGTGMPKHIQDRVFDPFFTTKEPGKGTGLGLSTVLGITKSHGGFLNLYSEEGRGTTFRVYLPAVTGAEVQAATEPTAELPRGNGELVLVADDEANVREITQRTLEAHGYRVITANDGAEAVALYASDRANIKVVITDMAMPFMDGPTTIRALQKLQPKLPAIAVSGMADQARLIELADNPNVVFLQKPYNAEKLLTTLRQAIAVK
ncbi:MAG: PAS domain S-box protein [Verrucomicrobiota bacterium]